jgi:glutathione S-transferase
VSVEHYFFQPLGTNSGRVYLALLENGVEFSRRELNGREIDHLQPDYLAINPKGQVPTLVRDGIPLPVDGQEQTESRIARFSSRNRRFR